MHSRAPKVSHFHVFGCKCFILKKGKKLDKFEARSVNGIFFGYASHSRAYRVLNLETNQIVETCEVTFDETQPRTRVVFECASDDELGEEIFQEEEHEHGGMVPATEHVVSYGPPWAHFLVGTRTNYSVGLWDYSAWATRHLMAWGARTTVEKYSDRKLYMSCTM
jgi:hypothetical protein